MDVGRSNWWGVPRLMSRIAIGRATNSSRRDTIHSVGGATNIGAMLSNRWRDSYIAIIVRGVEPQSSMPPRA